MDLLTQSHGLSWIALKIFKQLDKKSLFNSRKVCQSWRDCIDSDIFWPRLHIENVFKKIKKTIVPMPIVFKDNSQHFAHCRPKFFTSALDLYPDLKSIFAQALKQNYEVTQALIPKLKLYYKENRAEFRHPVHYAASIGDIEFMVMLHNNCGADYNFQHKLMCCNCTPLHIACHNDQVNMAEFLFEHLENEEQYKSAFLVACLADNIEIGNVFSDFVKLKLKLLLSYSGKICQKSPGKKYCFEWYQLQGRNCFAYFHAKTAL